MTCSMIPSRRGGELTHERESRCRASFRARVEALPAPAAAVTTGGPRASTGRLSGTARTGEHESAFVRAEQSHGLQCLAEVEQRTFSARRASARP
jgi:hypothetical protein